MKIYGKSLTWAAIFYGSILLDLFLSDLTRTFTPRYVTLLLSFIVLLFIFRECVKNFKVFLLCSFLAMVMMVNVLSYFSLTREIEFQYFYLFLMIVIGYILKDDIEKFKPYVKIIIVVNIFFIIRERISGQFLVPYSVDDIDFTNVYLQGYGQGTFSYVKNAADALSLSCLLLRKERKWIFLSFIATAMTGVRAAAIFVAAIFLIDFLLGINVKSCVERMHMNSKKALVIVILTVITIVAFAKVDDIYDRYLHFGKYEALLDLYSPNYTVREEMRGLHIKCFLSLNSVNELFGSGTYCADTIGNGAESYYLQMLPQYGVLFFGIIMLTYLRVCVISLKSMNNLTRFYPIFLVMIVSFYVRYGLTWMGGIILWAFIFNALDSAGRSSSIFAFQPKRSHIETVQ